MPTGKASIEFDSTTDGGFLIATLLYPTFFLDEVVEIVSFMMANARGQSRAIG